MTSRLVEMQARFQQKQMQEKEEKLLRLYENQQQRAFDRVGRGSAGSNTSVSSTTSGGGKVRQMFDERRQKAGIDRSYPLEPLTKSDRLKNHTKTPTPSTTTTHKTIVKSSIQKSVTNNMQMRNGRPIVSKREEEVQNLYSNNNGNESYEEQHQLFEDNNFNLIKMMNNHNLNDGVNLENEEMPQIDLVDETDNLFAPPVKLGNVGRKLPNTNSDNGLTKKRLGVENRGISMVNKESRGVAIKNDSKPSNIKKTIKTVVSSPIRSTQSTTSRLTPTTTLPKSQSMQSTTRSPPVNKTVATRPSPKQVAATKSAAARTDNLVDCKICGRRFASDRLTTHEAICNKTAKKKRKTYDATKHRVQGTELEQYVVRKGPKGAAARPQKKPSTKKDWRRTHEEFISTIRAAKQAQEHVARGGKLSDLPPPPPSSNPDYVQCPTCGRRFNETAAARHIPQCKNFMYNKPKGAVAGRPGKK